MLRPVLIAALAVTPSLASAANGMRPRTPAEFGATCAFLCSQHVGFMIGQNVLLDGGVGNTTM